MKSIILAAGKGTRLSPLTETTPKPMINIAWKPILEHILENIYNKVDEIIIVVKYLKDVIIKHFWDNFKWTKISYHIQWEEKWTAAAIKWIKFDDDFILINWDSIFEKKDLENLINSKNYWALVLETDTPEKYWIFEEDSNSFAKKIIEKPKEFVGNLANMWAYKFSSKIFELVEQISLSSRWEYELTDAINLFLEKEEFKLIKINWKIIDITYAWDILNANKYFLEKFENSVINWEVEEWVTIKWNIILWKWSILKSWTYIEWNVVFWENCIIWPNCYIRWNSVFWNNCHIWNAVEIKNSAIWNNTNIAHLSYVWDSIIWNNCNFWWWTKVANLRHDWKNMRAMVKWELIDTWLRKLGIIMWDNCKLWINTLCYPGRVLQANTTSLPWEIIK
jgi:bifunctional UDP-N-acetylglucosamine pyrophosphorylase/glucosamine-1-phosphate N-acetyltransferase